MEEIYSHRPREKGKSMRIEFPFSLGLKGSSWHQKMAKTKPQVHCNRYNFPNFYVLPAPFLPQRHRMLAIRETVIVEICLSVNLSVSLAPSFSLDPPFLAPSLSRALSSTFALRASLSRCLSLSLSRSPPVTRCLSLPRSLSRARARARPTLALARAFSLSLFERR